MEVRLTLDDDLIREMMTKTGASKATDLTKDALTMLHWAINEAANGRVILSTDRQGGDVQRLAMQTLNNAAAKSKIDVSNDRQGGAIQRLAMQTLNKAAAIGK